MKRIIPGLAIAGFWLLLLLKGSSQLFCSLIVLLALAAANEYVRMIDGRKVIFFERCFLCVIVALPAIFVSLWPRLNILSFAVVCSFFALSFYVLYRYSSLEDGYNLFCRLLFGLFYVGALGAHLVLLRFLPDGGGWLIIASAITACSDSSAYFVGRAIGRRKLCPNISPNKTIEGAVGGVCAGLLAAICFALLLLSSINWFFFVVSVVFLSIVGIAGDLTESIIKRATGIKDSATYLGGHGGILDRVDSLLFVAPTLYYLLVYSVIQ